ncbi:hypothetical protein H6G36_19770 [Anabaena minutissima FACHB-250]|nr:hypothetical protein [Anabaena minutissima FACHB-250]
MRVRARLLDRIYPFKTFLVDGNTAAAIFEYRTKLKDFTDDSGRQLLNGKRLQGKLMAKVANLLFNKLVEYAVGHRPSLRETTPKPPAGRSIGTKSSRS